jgi:CRISPR-associated exonuclease Cas4
MEHTSELVNIGNIIHQNSYKGQKKEIELEGIKIDLIDKTGGTIHEVKKSKALDDAHIWQLKYYLYYFKKLGLEMKGMIDYPKLRRNIKVELSNEDMEKIDSIINEINEILKLNFAPRPINKPYCKKCSYYEFCYV